MKILPYHNKILRVFIATLIIGSSILYNVHAFPSKTIHYQAQIRDNGGNLITTPVTIQFSIYNNLTNGGPGDIPSASGPLLWTETYDGSNGDCQKIIPNSQGMISVDLGSCVNFPSYLLFNERYYLGVKIETNSEATPRVPFSSVAYAENVRNVTFDDNLSNAFKIGTDTSDYITFDSSTGNELINILQNTVIGTSGTKLSIGAVIQGGVPLVFEGATNDSNTTSFAIEDPTSNQVITFPDETGMVVLNSTLAVATENNVTLDNLNDVTLASIAQGDMLYFDGAKWVNLPAGVSGYVLQTQGTGANPQWVDPTTLGTDDQLLSFDSVSLTLSIENGNDVDLSVLMDSKWDQVGYDGTNSTIIGGDTLKFNDPNTKGIVLEDNANVMNTIRIINTNDLGDSSGSAFILKGSGGDFRNQLSLELFGSSHNQVPFRDKAVIKARDKDLLIGTHSDSNQDIKFFSNVDNVTFQPSWIGTLNSTGVYFNSLQTMSSTPASFGVLVSDLGTGQLVAVDPNLFSVDTIYTADGDILADRYVTGNSSSFGLNFGDLSYLTIYNTNDVSISSLGNLSLEAQGLMNIGFNAGSALINDYRAGGDQRGLEYAGDYSANFTARSLVDKAYVDDHIASSIFDTDSNTGINVELNPNEDFVRFQTAGVERLLIDDQGRMRLASDPASSARNALFEIGKGVEDSTFSLVADSSFLNIVTFSDQSGDNIFRASGSLSNDDLLISLGDWDGGYDRASFALDSANNSIDIYNLGLRFYEQNSPNSDYIEFKAPNDVTSSTTWVLPTSDGTFGQVLKTDGAGNLSWVDNGSGFWSRSGTNLSPAIVGDDLLLNTGETLTISDLTQGSVVFAGSSGLISQDNVNFYWNDTNNRLGIRTNAPTQALDINGQIRIRGGVPGAGKVLTSSADGTGTWEDPSLADTGWINMSMVSGWNPDPTYGLVYRKIGNVVYVRGGANRSSWSAQPKIATLPSGFRPSKDMWFTMYCYAGSDPTNAFIPVRVTSSGDIYAVNGSTFGNDSSWIVLDFSFVADY